MEVSVFAGLAGGTRLGLGDRAGRTSTNGHWPFPCRGQALGRKYKMPANIRYDEQSSDAFDLANLLQRELHTIPVKPGRKRGVTS
jgi:hypothetical protein